MRRVRRYATPSTDVAAVYEKEIVECMAALSAGAKFEWESISAGAKMIGGELTMPTDVIRFLRSEGYLRNEDRLIVGTTPEAEKQRRQDAENACLSRRNKILSEYREAIRKAVNSDDALNSVIRQIHNDGGSDEAW